MQKIPFRRNVLYTGILQQTDEIALLNTLAFFNYFLATLQPDGATAIKKSELKTYFECRIEAKCVTYPVYVFF